MARKYAQLAIDLSTPVGLVATSFEEVVDDQNFEARHVFDQLWQTQIPFRNRQLLSRQTARRKQQTVSLQNQLFREHSQSMTFARTWLAENQNVLATS